MWLYKHNLADDLIDFNHDTGQWRAVLYEEKPAHAKRLDDLPVRGSYTVEDGRYYFTYWTDREEFIFADDQGFRLLLCKERTDGSTEMGSPGLRCEISPAKDSHGNLRPGRSLVILTNDENDMLKAIEYDASFYLRLLTNDFTAASMVRTLGDWDFFVALQEGIEYFREIANSGRSPLNISQADTVSIDGQARHISELLIVGSAQPCPKSGIWICSQDIHSRIQIEQGSVLPDLNGDNTSWVWVREA